jgi:succinoglycan biosynthesis protein ExoA
VRLLFNPKRLASAARNLGVRHGHGDIFVIIDGHCDVTRRDYLWQVVQAFRRSGADCLGRPQPLEIASPNAIQQAIALARRSWLGHNPSSFIYSSQEQFVRASSVAVAYRRHVFDRVGLFDERFDACEDVEFNHRVDQAGLSCFFTPAIGVTYHPRASLIALIYQLGRYGRGRIRLARKHAEALSLPAIAPMLCGLFLAATGVLGLWFPMMATAFCCCVLLYAAVLCGTSVALALRSFQPESLVWLPLVFLSIHTGFAWGTLSELCRRKWPPSAADDSERWSLVPRIPADHSEAPILARTAA